MTRNAVYPVFLAMALVALLVCACSKSDKTSGAKPTAGGTPGAAVKPGGAPVKPEPAAQPATPKELGEKIGAVYLEAMQGAAKLVEGKPAPADVKAKVEALKEKYVQQLVELGKKREPLSAQDKAAVDSAISLAVMRAGSEPWYKGYSEAVQSYFGKDQELHKLLTSFNIIGQYASFDLLKKQEPKEAARLGIK
jgi:hypothetical protein